ncbi:transposase [Streptomyces sp. NBC_00111]|uniref:transposase n=1 Tax=Streptomyces sp. NBC_00111 TaxID=2975655 RepID=UPI00386B827D
MGVGASGRGELSDAEWERLRPLLPVSNGRCGRWRDHRPVIDGILHRVRTDVHWRDLSERYGPWKPPTRATGSGRRPTVLGSVFCSSSRPRLTQPAKSTGASRWIPPAWARISTRLARESLHHPP